MLTFTQRLLRRVSQLEYAHRAILANLTDPRTPDHSRRHLLDMMLARSAEQIAGLKLDLTHVEVYAAPVPSYLPPVVEPVAAGA